MRKKLAELIDAVAAWVRPDEKKSPLDEEDWKEVKACLNNASTSLKEAERVIKDKALSDADAAFAQELALIGELSLDLRQQIESLEVRAGPAPDGQSDGKAATDGQPAAAAAGGAQSA